MIELVEQDAGYKSYASSKIQSLLQHRGLAEQNLCLSKREAALIGYAPKLVFSFGRDNGGVFVVLATMKDKTTVIFRLDGTSAGLDAGSIWVEVQKKYRIGKAARAYFSKLIGGQESTTKPKSSPRPSTDFVVV